MNKQIITISLIVLIIAISLVYFFYQPKSSRNDVPEIIPADWESHYKYDSRDPYGTYMFYELLKRSTFDFKLVEGFATDEIVQCTKDSSGKLLVFIGNDYTNNEDLWLRINEFLNAGNKALFILEEDPQQLESYYNGVFEVSSICDSVSELRLAKEENVKYSFDKLNEFKRESVNWKFFFMKDSLNIEKDTNSIYAGAYLITGYNYDYYFIAQEVNEYDKPVLIEMQYGNGSLLIHRAPLAFTNIALLEEKNVDHLEKILEEINYEGIIYNIPPKKKNPKDGKEKKSPLQFILSSPALSWAYYITIGCLLLFLIFNVKRRQAAIPIAPPKANSTLEFVDALSKIYYQKHNNPNIVKHKYRIFITFIRTHYHINMIKDRTEFARVISMKSGIGVKEVESLLNRMEAYSKMNELSDDQLIVLHKQLDNFYKNCK